MFSMSDEVIAHRFFEYAVSSRGNCHGHCKKPIPEGALRYGTKVHIQDHDSISWRCIDCVTHQQAENIRSVAADAKQSVHDFLTVPPHESHGPPPHIVDLFVEYLEALHLNKEEDISRLSSLLKRHRKEVAAEEPKSKRSKKQSSKPDVDAAHLDEQIKVLCLLNTI